LEVEKDSSKGSIKRVIIIYPKRSSPQRKDKSVLTEGYKEISHKKGTKRAALNKGSICEKLYKGSLFRVISLRFQIKIVL